MAYLGGGGGGSGKKKGILLLKVPHFLFQGGFSEVEGDLVGGVLSS